MTIFNLPPVGRGEVDVIVRFLGATPAAVYIRCGFLGMVRVCMRSTEFDAVPVVGPVMCTDPRKMINVTMPSMQNICGIDTVLVLRVIDGKPARPTPRDFFRVPDNVFVVREILEHYEPFTSRSRLQVNMVATRIDPETPLEQLVDSTLLQCLRYNMLCLQLHNDNNNDNNNNNNCNRTDLACDTPIGSIPHAYGPRQPAHAELPSFTVNYSAIREDPTVGLISQESLSFETEMNLDRLQENIINLRRVVEIVRGPRSLRVRTFLRGFRAPLSNVSRMPLEILGLIAEKV